MELKKNRAVVVVASGSSRRMGFDKLGAEVAGKPVLWHTVQIMCQANNIRQVVVVTPEERFSWVQDVAREGVELIRVNGGAERPDSVRAGLSALDPEVELVAVHDGARPLVGLEAIEVTFTTAAEVGAAVLARRVTDTLKREDAGGFSGEAVSREGLWAMETPQTFRVDWLREAYEQVGSGAKAVTDEVSALELSGRKTKFVESTAPNPKVTVPGDLVLLEHLMAEKR